MSKFLKSSTGMPRGSSVQGTDIASGAATSSQGLFADGAGGSAFRALLAGDLPTITLTGDVTGSASGGSIVTAIGTNKVTNSQFRQSAGLSVVGNSTNATANVADITGTTDQVMRVSSAGTTLGFGAVNLAAAAAVTGTLPNGNTTATSAATANTIVSRDANINTKVNAVIENSATTATGGTTTTLTVSSAPFQQFTGTTTQTVVLPDATTLTNGWKYWVANRSTGIVTVNANGGGTLQAMAGATFAIYTLISNGTSAGTWDTEYVAPSSGGGGMAGGGYLAKSANYSLASGDSTKVIGCDTTTAAFSLTFPTPAAGLTFTVKDVTGNFGTNNLTMVRAGSEKIENVAASMILSANYGSWTFYCGDGTNWIIIAH